jgi:hypothetical protein
VLDFFGGCEAGCGGGYQFRYSLTLPESTWREVDWTIDSPVDRYVGASGWAYGFGSCGDLERGDGDQLCGLTHERAVAIVPASTFAGESYLRLRAGASNAQLDVLAIGDDLVVVQAGVLKSRWSMDLPSHVSLSLAIDRRGHIFGVIDGDAARWDHGWVPLGTDESTRGRRNVLLPELESLEADALTTLPVGSLRGRRVRRSGLPNRGHRE